MKSYLPVNALQKPKPYSVVLFIVCCFVMVVLLEMSTYLFNIKVRIKVLSKVHMFCLLKKSTRNCLGKSTVKRMFCLIVSWKFLSFCPI